MHAKRLVPSQLSGRPPHPCSVPGHNPPQEVTWLSNIGGARQGRFHVRGYVPDVVPGVSIPILRQGTKLCTRISNNNWEETLVNTI